METLSASELMIGNWVNDFAMEPHQVIHLTKDKIILETPIPLTEDLLLKFRFEPLFSGAGYYKNHVEIGHNHNGFYIIASGHKIEYIHQLQNLYFALTGEELKLK
jgi:hypothetical protein